MKKEIIEESMLENENEEGDGHQNEGAEGQQESHEEQQNVSNNLDHSEIDNQILRYLEQQQMH